MEIGAAAEAQQRKEHETSEGKEADESERVRHRRGMEMDPKLLSDSGCSG